MADDKIEKDENRSKTEDESSSDESLDLDLELKCETCSKTFTSLKCLVQHEKSGKHYKKLSQKKLEKEVNENIKGEISSEFSDFMLYPKPYAGCDICEKEFSGPESFHQHLKSKVHHKKVAKAKFLEQVTEDGKIDKEKFKLIYKQKKTPQEGFHALGASAYSPTLEETESYDNVIAESHQFECLECEKVFTGVDPWFQHLVSKTHEKTLKQKKLLDRVTAGPSSKSPSAESGVASSSSSQNLDAIEVDGDVLICRLCHKSFSGPESAAAHLKSRGHAKNISFKEWKIQHSAILKTQKTKAQDHRCENQAPVPAPTTEFEGNKPMSSSEIVDKDVNNRTEKDNSELKEESGEGLKNPDSASSDAADETEKVSKAERENVLLCYKSYKNYKKIMNEIEEVNRREK